MDILTRAELEQLMRKEQQWCVSIYMPTHRTGREAQQDPIRLKNLLGEAEKRLSDEGVGRRDVQKMLEPASKLLRDSHFWQHQSDGLAIFLSSNRVLRYRLPLNFQELVVVDDHFHIKPLLPLFTGDGQFYILALSQNKIRLLNGTRDSVSEVDIGQVGGSLAEAIPSDDHQVSLQLHTSGSTDGMFGSGSVTFHGQGGGSDESSKNELLRYFHIVSDGLTEFLQEDRRPLVLAGVEYLLPIYTEANTYLNLIDTVIKGNPDLLSADELHKSAWDIIEPSSRQPKKRLSSITNNLLARQAHKSQTHWKRSFQPLFKAGLKRCSPLPECSNGVSLIQLHMRLLYMIKWSPATSTCWTWRLFRPI